MPKHEGDIGSRKSLSFFAQLAQRHRVYFRLYERILHLALTMLLEAEIGSTERKKIVASTVLARIIESTQAAILLSRRGLERDVGALIRVIFEAFVILKCIGEDDTFLQRYLSSQLIQQRKLAGAAKGLPGITPERAAEMTRRENALRRDAEELGAQEMSIEASARRVGIHSEYVLIFRQTSPYIHTAPSILEDFVRESPEGTVTELAFGLRDRLVPIHVATISEYLLRAAGVFGQVTGIDRRKRWKLLKTRLTELKPEWPD